MKTTPYRWEEAEPEARGAALPDRAGVAVVGGGYAGLSAALTLARLGHVAFTFDFLSHLGAEGGVHYAAGCQGSGVAVASWMGHQAALEVAGAANEPFALDGLPFPTKALYDGRPWFLPFVGGWYRLRDGLDRLRG